MIKFIVILCAIAFMFLGTDCKKDPITPDDDQPLDSTSHNFIWQKFTFGGDAGSCVLNDVAIINDTLAYAVGAIYLKDSAGNFDPQPYNLAVWNGTTWNIQKVPYFYQGQPFYNPIQSIFVRSSNDIWFCGNGVIHWDGVHFIEMPVPSSEWGQDRMNKMWGSGNDLYVTGNGGSIARFNGSSWQKLNSGTTLDIQDIWGAYNSKTSQWEILAVAGKPLISSERSLLRISGSSITTLSDQGIVYSLSSVWFVPNRHYYVVGNGIYEKKKLEDAQWANGPLDITTFYTNTVRGSNINDVFVGGAYGELLHFNGSSWKSLKESTGLQNGQYYKIAVSENTILAVGEESPSAIILQGKHLK